MSEKSYWNHIKEAGVKVSIYDGVEVFKAGFGEYPSWVGDLLAVHWILSEVSNGGLKQFFWNSTGILAPEAVEGFSQMGLPEVAKVVKEAMAFFGAEYPRDKNRRRELLGDCEGSPFVAMEERLYALSDDGFEKFYETMDDYAKKNAA